MRVEIIPLATKSFRNGDCQKGPFVSAALLAPSKRAWSWTDRSKKKTDRRRRVATLVVALARRPRAGVRRPLSDMLGALHPVQLQLWSSSTGLVLENLLAT